THGTGSAPPAVTVAGSAAPTGADRSSGTSTTTSPSPAGTVARPDTPAPSTATVTGAPVRVTVTSRTWWGSCAVPTNRSLDSTPVMRTDTATPLRGNSSL